MQYPIRWLTVVLVALCFSTPVQGKEWKELAQGLLLGEFACPLKSPVVDYPVVILKINSTRYSLRLLSASEHGGKAKMAREWCEEFGLLAAINASMYMSQDTRKSTGHMRNYAHINNPKMNPESSEEDWCNLDIQRRMWHCPSLRKKTRSHPI